LSVIGTSIHLPAGSRAPTGPSLLRQYCWLAFR
jgi:hypothetical protein